MNPLEVLKYTRGERTPEVGASPFLSTAYNCLSAGVITVCVSYSPFLALNQCLTSEDTGKELNGLLSSNVQLWEKAGRGEDKRGGGRGSQMEEKERRGGRAEEEEEREGRRPGGERERGKHSCQRREKEPKELEGIGAGAYHHAQRLLDGPAFAVLTDDGAIELEFP